MASDIGDDLVTPLSVDARWYLIGGATATGILLIFEDQISDPLQTRTVQDKPLGKYSKYGDIAGQLVPNALYAVGMLTDYWLTGDRQPLKLSLLMVKATAYSAAVTNVLKYAVREPRPDGSDRYSFPSGHATSAFAFASVIGAEHAWYWGVPAYTLATFVAYSRMNDNRHEIHDVIAGATIGMSYGIGLATKEFHNDLPSSSWDFHLQPTGDLGGAVALASRDF